ncbi:MAG TPA: hypothetical protein VMM55_13010 [Thermohalobaculum sp.]|nr:hypothetical protein [Thermohalobaculum sp.]
MDWLQHARSPALRKRGRETKLVLGEVARQDPDLSLVELLVDARHLRQQVFDSKVSSLRERRLGREHRAIARTLPLAFLAPDIVEAILEGRQPIELTASKLKQLAPGLLDWDSQRRVLGFATTALNRRTELHAGNRCSSPGTAIVPNCYFGGVTRNRNQSKPPRGARNGVSQPQIRKRETTGGG